MERAFFYGAGTAIVTPFDENGDIDFERFEELIEFQIENDADAIVVCGTTGESSTLDVDEFLSVVSFCVEKVDKRFPVIVGTGSNDTKKSIKRSKEAERLGADAILLITPYYNKTSQNGLVRHFGTICDSVSLPAILYNVPSRTGMTIDIDTYSELERIPNIVGIKEASGNIGYVAKIFQACGDRFDIYSGNDDMIVPYMSLGAKGVISVASNIIPNVIHQMCDLCLNGMFEKARNLQIAFLDVINALFIEVNPIPVKAALKMIGYDVGKPRLPLCEISPEHKMILENALWNHGIVK